MGSVRAAIVWVLSCVLWSRFGCFVWPRAGKIWCLVFQDWTCSLIVSKLVLFESSGSDCSEERFVCVCTSCTTACIWPCLNLPRSNHTAVDTLVQICTIIFALVRQQVHSAATLFTSCLCLIENRALTRQVLAHVAVSQTASCSARQEYSLNWAWIHGCLAAAWFTCTLEGGARSEQLFTVLSGRILIVLSAWSLGDLPNVLDGEVYVWPWHLLGPQNLVNACHSVIISELWGLAVPLDK